MFLINQKENRILPITETTFSKHGLKEREHLQEWLANNPEAFGEELLIIQKEFSGFTETKERLDLLALDKQGNIVVIENKLDDSGRDVTWQVLKYASYCSTLSKQDIVKIFQDYLSRTSNNGTAEEKLSEFFDDKDFEELQLNKGQTQRIIMVAGNFRKVVTSTVLWLMNYKLRIQCYKVTPFLLGDQLLLNMEQIIPMKEAEEYTISMAEKTQEDINAQEELKSRHHIRKEFWVKLLGKMNSKSQLFQNISPSINHWLTAGSGVRGVAYTFCISKAYARCELYIDRGDKEENKFVYDFFKSSSEIIEHEFGSKLIWERLDEKKGCRIKYENNSFNVFEKDQWDDMIVFLIDTMMRMEEAFKNHIKKVGQKLKNEEM